jgi:hypothetical protein
MKKIRLFIYIILVVFILYTLYKILLIYVLNISSLQTSYIYHSKSIDVSKRKDLYIASYRLAKTTNTNYFIEALLPEEIFIEKEKIIYPQYYFYWGKSEIGSRTTMNANLFLNLSKSGEYDIRSPSSTLPNEKDNIDKYRRDLYYFFKDSPTEIIFIIENRESKLQIDTIIFKKVIN